MPDPSSATTIDPVTLAVLRGRLEQVADENPDAKFGDFEQTSLDGYIKAIEQKVARGNEPIADVISENLLGAPCARDLRFVFCQKRLNIVFVIFARRPEFRIDEPRHFDHRIR